MATVKKFRFSELFAGKRERQREKALDFLNDKPHEHNVLI